ncbi:PspC domain-containing protein [Spongiactinospora sp. TRM90649]|uniref:PspC domain-containing protein n=1 Tax=Spongiactinospora sp. TRM90649 TaxID=3031114 RepID=UPI0023F9052C|nr:PspC domain-containing protein [Spongiactinospora sp. TRM90649]MDF5751344.1 PspC domain-containing protein [Spongiactinospora sp. TRM90649]
MSDTGDDAREPAPEEARAERHVPAPDPSGDTREPADDTSGPDPSADPSAQPRGQQNARPNENGRQSEDDGFRYGVARSQEGRMLTGVCAGLGRRAGIDPVLIRVAFAALVLASGIGIMLYVVAYLLMRTPDGGPGHVEQWTNRLFDAETVMALLTGVFAVGLAVNLASGGIGLGTLVVATLFAITLLAAHAGGVDILALLRSLPERISGRRGVRHAPPPGPAPVYGPPSQPQPQPQPQSYAYYAPPPPPPAPPAPPTPGQSAGPTAGPTTTLPSGPYRWTASASMAESAPQAPERPGRPPEPQDAPEAPEAQGAQGAPREAPTAASRVTPPHPSNGGPFAPHGPYAQAPYQPLDPRRRADQPGSYYPPVPAQVPHGGPWAPAPPAQPRKARRPRTFLGTITVFLAFIVGGIVMAVQSRPGEPGGVVGVHMVGGAMLITVGIGLLVAAWYGRGAALVAAGTVMAIAVAVAGAAIPDVPRSFGAYTWHPRDLSAAQREYQVDVGEGTLDLSDLPFPPGSRTSFRVNVSVGEVRVILPPDVRAEVKARSRVGDVKIDHSIKGGPNARQEKILEPEVRPSGEAATVVLDIRAGVADVEVRRGA